ncbi:MAG TPA: hypothetical protein VGB69_09630 [Edaphobacter sp.]
MSDHTEFMPTFLLNLRQDKGPEPYVVSCSIVGEITGFRGVVRRFRSMEDLAISLERARIMPLRYSQAIFDASDGKACSFPINLNEAQKLALIQTDSTE